MADSNIGGCVRLPKTQSRFAVIRELAAARVAAGVARIDLAEMAGYHVQILGRYERGETTPSLQALTDIANALGFRLTITALLTATGEAQSND